MRCRTALSDRSREIAILTLAVLRRSDFEWYLHERVGRRVVLTESELAGILRGEEVQTLAEQEAIVLRVTTALATGGDLDDETHALAEAVLGQEQLAELVVLVGYYDLLALSLRVWRTPLPAVEQSPFGAMAAR